MARGWVHTVNRNRRWHNEIEGEGILSAHTTRDEAVASGRAAAQERRTEHVVHDLDGTIDSRNSYSTDPLRPRE